MIHLYREYSYEPDYGGRHIFMRLVGEFENRDAIREQVEAVGAVFAVFEGKGEPNVLGLHETYELTEFVEAYDNTNAPGPNVKLRKLDTKKKLKEVKEVMDDYEKRKAEFESRYA